MRVVGPLGTCRRWSIWPLFALLDWDLGRRSWSRLSVNVHVREIKVGGRSGADRGAVVRVDLLDRTSWWWTYSDELVLVEADALNHNLDLALDNQTNWTVWELGPVILSQLTTILDVLTSRRGTSLCCYARLSKLNFCGLVFRLRFGGCFPAFTTPSGC